MVYTRIELCHISDLVKHLKSTGYTKEEYPSKKTCITELKTRGVFQIDIQSTRGKQQTPRTREMNYSKRHMVQPQPVGDVFKNPVFERQLTFNQPTPTPASTNDTITPNPVVVQKAYSYDASYKYLDVTGQLNVNNKLIVAGNDVNALISTIDQSYSGLQDMLDAISDEIKNLDDKTSDLSNMQLPMYNVAKTISYDELQTNIETKNKERFSVVANVEFDGKLIDSTAYIQISFNARIDGFVNESLNCTCKIPLQTNLIPDKNPVLNFNSNNELVDVFRFYPVSHNIVSYINDDIIDPNRDLAQ